MAKTTLQTDKMNEAEYVKFVENILVKLTENAELFEDQDPSIADLQDMLDVFKKAQADASYRDMRFVLIKNQQLVLLKRMVYELSLYVEKVAKGDPVVILAAGFTPTRPHLSVGSAPKPQKLRAKVDIRARGMMILQVESWKSALMYQFEYRKKDADTEWTKVLSPRTKIVLENLDSMQEYEFRVAYLGRDPLVVYSDVLTAPVF